MAEMDNSLYWADNYVQKKCTAETALKSIRSGQRIFIGSACGEPQELVRALSQAAKRHSGLEIVRMMSQETISLTEIANRTQDFSLNIRNIYLGTARAESVVHKRRFITPMNMSEVPALFKTRKLPIDVALIQVSPPDDFGWMSLGISVDVTLAAASSARMVIAQVNPKMPRVLGQSFFHVNNVAYIVEHEEPLLAVNASIHSEKAVLIGSHIARLIEDGATLQIGLDAASQATVRALAEKKDLGFHSQYITDDVMHLFAKGVITNRQKGYNEGKLVASAAIGSQHLYEFLDDNPAVEFQPSDHVNDPFVIAQHYRMVSMNVAKTIDLTGQVAAEADPKTFFAGVSGIPDFVRGAKRSVGGKSILMLPSTSEDEKVSHIVPMLKDMAVVVPRGDVQWVVTEFGSVNLSGKSLQERAIAMISLAHPKFRDELFQAAKNAELISSQRSLGEAVHSIYPVKLEERIDRKGIKIMIRPAKPVDERRIQEHYYALEKNDVFLRFFHDKTSFSRSEIETKSQTDYIKDLTLIGVVGEFGFDKVIAVGEYLLMPQNNLAEVAFSVSKEYRGLAIATLLLRKLAAAARENGISGLLAYTAPNNKAMIRLFKTLPYKVKTSFSEDSLVLQCRFDELDKPV
jgi:acyl-CoA hydrolase/RimJ/RimL family protein N-acetyltransferase